MFISFANYIIFSVKLSKHLKESHRELCKFVCARCDKQLNTHTLLRQHNFRVHLEGQFECLFFGCQFQANTRNEAQKHIFKCHKTATLVCSEEGCFKTFKQKFHLDYHIRTHKKEKPFRCAQCGKSFCQNSILQRHLLTHSVLKPFKCSQCNKCYATQQNLQTHTRIHTQNKCYRCKWSECNYASTDQSGIISHIRRKHFGLPKSKKEQESRGIVDDRDVRQYYEKL